MTTNCDKHKKERGSGSVRAPLHSEQVSLKNYSCQTDPLPKNGEDFTKPPGSYHEVGLSELRDHWHKGIQRVRR